MDNKDMDWFDAEIAEEMESWCAVGEMIMKDYEHDKEIYNQALEDLQERIDEEYYDGGYGDYHEVAMIVRMIEQMKDSKE